MPTRTEYEKSLVEETKQIFRRYKDNSARIMWEQNVQEDREFRLGKQWTDLQVKELAKRGQAPLVVNRIHPAVETAKALLCARKPGIKASAREDSDNKVAHVFNDLFEYIWDISSGNSEFKQIVDDSYVASLGYALVYQDGLADNGKGEVKMMSLDPLDIYIDPASRHKLFDDSANILYSRLYTKSQAKQYKPLYTALVESITEGAQTERPTTNRTDQGATIFPETDETIGDAEEVIRGIERYQMVFTNKFRIFDASSGNEQLYTSDEFKEYVKQPAWLIDGKPYTTQKAAERVINQYNQMMQQMQQAAAQGQEVGEMPPEPVIQTFTIADMVRQEVVQVVKIRSKNVRVISIMGDKLLYVRELPANLHTYPIIPFPSIHTGTPFPTSDVRMCKGLQEYVNKMRSLIVAHATTSTNTKILVPRGSVDMNKFEIAWAKPGVAIEVDYEYGVPSTVAPTPLPTELYANQRQAMEDINHQFGIYESMMGNNANAPTTYKATISLDEFGQRKIGSRLADLEVGLKRMAEVMIPFIQQLYTQQKTMRIVNPNNSINEFMINQRLYNDKTQEVEVINDISRGSYDIKIVTGATLPSNRYAEFELHMEAYKLGLIDKQEVLKKSDIYDMEGVLQRTGEVQQLKAALEEAGGKIKELEGDLQTADREVKHAKMDAEMSKFKAGLKGTESEVAAAKQIYMNSLQSSEKEFNKDLEREKKDMMDKPTK